MASRDSDVVTVAQPASGHHFTLEGILLSDYSRINPRDRVLDPGCSTGVISLLLDSRHPHITKTLPSLIRRPPASAAAAGI